LIREIQIQKPIHSVQFLHDETMWAASQDKYLYVYNHEGVQVNEIITAQRTRYMQFLPYHFLLVCASPEKEALAFLDMSEKQKVVANMFNECLRSSCLRANPYNALVSVGSTKGTVSTWSPNIRKPVEELLAHKGTIRDIAFSRDGMRMVTAGDDQKISLWDVRNTSTMINTVKIPPGYIIKSIDVSGKDMVSLAYDNVVKVYNDAFTGQMKFEKPYMQHLLNRTQKVENVKFAPYEDILGIGHSQGYCSIVIPGSGQSQVDTSEVNIFGNATARNRKEVQMLLEKVRFRTP